MKANISTYKKHFFLNTSSMPLSQIYNTNKDFFQTASPKKVYNLTENIVWICKQCGHTHIGATSPDKCPICNLDHSFYKNI